MPGPADARRHLTYEPQHEWKPGSRAVVADGHRPNTCGRPGYDVRASTIRSWVTAWLSSEKHGWIDLSRYLTMRAPSRLAARCLARLPIRSSWLCCWSLRSCCIGPNWGGRCVLLRPFLENPKQHYWQDLVVRELWRQLGWVSRISLVSGVVMAMYSCLPGKCRPLWFWASLAANTMMFGLYLGQAY